jgi:deoxyribodipyrimidine photo-lyase
MEISNVRLIWHRRDLRLYDNELYHSSAHPGVQTTNHESHISSVTSSPSVSLFVFDNGYFQPKQSSSSSNYDTVWCGPHAARVLIEAVTTLRHQIRSIGGELIIRVGDPTIIVPQIAKEIGATEIVYGEEPGTYEREVSQTIEETYMNQNKRHNDDGDENKPVKLVSKVGYTLYHPNDLPFDPNKWNQLAHPKNKHQRKKNGRTTQTNNVQSMDADSSSFACPHIDLVDISPDRFKGMCRIMGDFRNAARGSTSVRLPLEAPKRLVKPLSCKGLDVGYIPSLEELMDPLLNAERPILGMDPMTIETIVKSAIQIRDNKIKNNIDDDEECQDGGESAALERLDYFIGQGHAAVANRSQADVSNNNSSRFSIHFSLGTLSPRTVYWKAHDAGEDCKWLKSHLEMRDFFLYTAFAAGKRLFRQRGLPLGKQPREIKWTNPSVDETNWRRWATGETHLPLVDAAMKELMLTGYCSNRVRQNAASVLTKDMQIDWRIGAEWFQFLLQDHCVGANYGNWVYFSGVGPDPKNRHFRTVSQSIRYDPKGTYVKKWFPALREVPSIEAIFRPWDFHISGFESPIVDPKTQFTWQDLQRLEEKGKLIQEDDEIQE